MKGENIMNDKLNKKADKLIRFCEKSQAINHPIDTHLIVNCEEYVQKLYINMLCLIAYYENEDCESQNIFIERIIAGCGNKSSIHDHILKALELNDDDFYEFFKACKENSLNELFFIDALIIACGKGNINDKQITLLSQIADVLGFDKDKVEVLTQTAIAILELDSEKYVEIVSSEENRKYKFFCDIQCYTKLFVKGLLINTFELMHYYNASIDKSDDSLIDFMSNKKKLLLENCYIRTVLKIVGTVDVSIVKCDISSAIDFKDVPNVNVLNCYAHDIKYYHFLYFDSEKPFNISINNSEFKNIEVCSSSCYGRDYALITKQKIMDRYSERYTPFNLVIDNCNFTNIYTCFKNSDQICDTKSVICRYGSVEVTNSGFYSCGRNQQLLFESSPCGNVYKEIISENNEVVNCYRLKW